MEFDHESSFRGDFGAVVYGDGGAGEDVDTLFQAFGNLGIIAPRDGFLFFGIVDEDENRLAVVVAEECVCVVAGDKM